ncbi:MAG TPA: hypothetical protein V6C90_25005 [Coleofasciculaceae cyanobacterium]
MTKIIPLCGKRLEVLRVLNPCTSRYPLKGCLHCVPTEPVAPRDLGGSQVGQGERPPIGEPSTNKKRPPN